MVQKISSNFGKKSKIFVKIRSKFQTWSHVWRNLDQNYCWTFSIETSKNLKYNNFEVYPTEGPTTNYVYNFLAKICQTCDQVSDLNFVIGTVKNIDSALESLKKSASKDNAAALVGLGYYYMSEGDEIETAVGYYEQAAQLGSPDAMHNLALINKSGKYPNRPPNDAYCFHQYLRAAQLGPGI